MLVLGIMACQWLVIVDDLVGTEKPRAVPICIEPTFILAAQCYTCVPATHLPRMRWFSLSRGKALARPAALLLVVTDIKNHLCEGFPVHYTLVRKCVKVVGKIPALMYLVLCTVKMIPRIQNQVN